jgi:hypothetical protein
MGTRTNIQIEHNQKYICSKYINMDGHVQNWAPILITALNQTSPTDILKNRQLFKFMCDDDYGRNVLSYQCIVDISEDKYKVTIHGYNNKLIFEGTLDEFAEKYDEIH